MSHLKKWWAAHAVWVLSLASWLVPSIQNWISSHPGSFVAAIGVIVLGKIAQLEKSIASPSPTATPVTQMKKN